VVVMGFCEAWCGGGSVTRSIWRFVARWRWFMWWRVNGGLAVAVVGGGRQLLGVGACVVATRVGERFWWWCDEVQPSVSPHCWLSDSRSAGDLLEVEAFVQGGVSRWFSVVVL
jgi:hypothetical protein